MWKPSSFPVGTCTLHVTLISLSFLVYKMGPSGPQITSFIRCLVITLMRKKNRFSARTIDYIEFACSPMSVWVFSGGPSFLPYPKDVRVRWINVSTLFPTEWVWGVCTLSWKGILSRVGSHLPPWAARIGSSPLWPWTGLSELEICIHLSYMCG